MTDIQASVGIKQLEKHDWLLRERRKIAIRYHEAFKKIPDLQLPVEKPGYESNYQSYSIYLKNARPGLRNELMQSLLDKGISTRRGVMCTHLETAYKEEYKGLSLPFSEDLQRNSIIIPLYVPMKPEETEEVTEKFIEVYSNLR